jgi:hypothetical protein
VNSGIAVSGAARIATASANVRQQFWTGIDADRRILAQLSRRACSSVDHSILSAETVERPFAHIRKALERRPHRQDPWSLGYHG